MKMIKLTGPNGSTYINSECIEAVIERDEELDNVKVNSLVIPKPPAEGNEGYVVVETCEEVVALLELADIEAAGDMT